MNDTGRSRSSTLESAIIDVPRPADFDEFWAESLRLLDTVDARPSLRHLPERSTERVDVYELHYSGFHGVRIAAWCTMPAGRTGPLPTVVHIPGYISEPSIMKSWSERGYLTVALAPRGKLRSNDLVNPGYPGLLTADITDRFTYAYRGFYLDVIRALDVVAELEQVDAERIGVWGSSQGGGLGIVAAALRPNIVRAFAAGAPYLCGIMESARLTHSYPYEEINEFLRVHPEAEAEATETAAYYDGMNFAPAVRAPSLVYLGLEDDVCPPETGFAVYRELGGVKELHTYPRCAHDAGLRWVIPKVEAFLDGHLKQAAERDGVNA
ncbi:acetylxylan esterase [Actinoalloteichus hymeniacidonis]|uniref:Acetyl esterase (Deacetylase) n=1 Tax=Actinoalloteichus hymeniacidonis TaxID=340345 RepID=A0AAC9MZP8_9PSEU|nr:acetylxylan esterase [Actinoalloteichus hymeniacidonis]AOS64186.1 acetyl esterase (deacetylase) [Actinoalloteichus hymeniacidonis]MBB5907746.1 cephalosporin-C deacetylase [Actinoalloteichus hymeniacidonis]